MLKTPFIVRKNEESKDSKAKKDGLDMTSDLKMPVVFVGHGSPMNAIGQNRARTGWKEEAERLPKPSVILVVSAHWMTKGLFVRKTEENRQIYDMYGFPEALYQVHYEPKGSPQCADRVLELLKDQAHVNNDWGLDHGAWSVLCNMYPKADVPVVMLSTDITADARTLYETGVKLRPLREEGVLILTSGNIVHNLHRVDWELEGGYDWADTFDAQIRDAILQKHFEIPINFRKLKDYRMAIPTVEHYAPLLVALGAADEKDSIRVWNEYRELGSMSMTSYTFED